MGKMAMPPGYRFKPLDEELVDYYLSRKIHGEPLPLNVVEERDLYGDYPPWDICRGLNGDCYFFTRLKKTSKNRISRTAGGGEWHGNARGKEIKDGRSKRVIGVKKQFSFKPRKGKRSGDNSSSSSDGGFENGWIMHEYSLMGKTDSDDHGYVLCHISKHDKGKKEDDGGDGPVIHEDGTLMGETFNHQVVDSEGFDQGFNNEGFDQWFNNLALDNLYAKETDYQFKDGVETVEENVTVDQPVEFQPTCPINNEKPTEDGNPGSVYLQEDDWLQDFDSIDMSDWLD